MRALCRGGLTCKRDRDNSSLPFAAPFLRRGWPFLRIIQGMIDRHMLFLAINGHHLVLGLSAIACGLTSVVFTSERSRGLLIFLGIMLSLFSLFALFELARSSGKLTVAFPLAFLLEINFIIAFAKTRELFAGVMAALSVVGIGLVALGAFG